MSDSKHRIHVLAVSGEPRGLAALKQELKDAFDVRIALLGDAAVSALADMAADAVVVAFEEDAGQSLAAYKGLAAAAGGAPILFVAGTDSEADEASALALGAADYCLRRQTGEALVRRIGLRVAEGRRKCAAPAEPSPEALLAGKTILIAEDVALNREIMAAVLSPAGDLTLEFARNGAEAVEMFARAPGKYALICMDILMPEMDGLAAARAIRRLGHEEARRVPIIALSAGDAGSGREQCLAAGMNGYLEKPVDYEEFIHIVASLPELAEA